MGRVLYSSNVADIRGKISGGVHSRNKGGAIIRTKVTPTNPSSVHQSHQRSLQSNIAKAWSGTLSDTQRQAWTAGGKTAGAVSVFGNGLILSGIAFFQKVNRIILNAGGSMVLNAPTSKQVDSILSSTLTANHVGSVLTLAFTPTPLVAPAGAYIFITPALSPGIGNVTPYLRFLNFYSAAASPLDLSADWITRFGAFPTTAGLRIGGTIQVVDDTTGAISAAAGFGTLIS